MVTYGATYMVLISLINCVPYYYVRIFIYIFYNIYFLVFRHFCFYVRFLGFYKGKVVEFLTLVFYISFINRYVKVFWRLLFSNLICTFTINLLIKKIFYINFYKEIEYWNKNNTKCIKVYSISLNFIELILILLFLIIINIILLIYIIV